MMESIKKIIQKNKKANIIIIEDNKPTYVVLSFEEYEKLANQQSGFSFPERTNFLAAPMNEEIALEEVNQEIINLQAPKEDILEDIVVEDIAFNPESKEIRIEDIPLL